METKKMAAHQSVTNDTLVHLGTNIIVDVSMEDPIILKNSDLSDVSSVVIFLHGIGSDPLVDFKNIIAYCPDIKSKILVFPKAPKRQISLFKREMHAWSDILSGDFEHGALDWKSFRKNVEDLSFWIEGIKSIYGVQKVIVGGFSQGAFNVWAGIQSFYKTTAGMAIFSTSINKEFSRILQHDIATYPFLYCYGQEDILMPSYFCNKSHESMLNDFGSTNLTHYEAGHGHEIDQHSAQLFWKWEALI